MIEKAMMNRDLWALTPDANLRIREAVEVWIDDEDAFSLVSLFKVVKEERARLARRLDLPIGTKCNAWIVHIVARMYASTPVEVRERYIENGEVWYRVSSAHADDDDDEPRVARVVWHRLTEIET